MSTARRMNEPAERLTRLCAAMADTMAAHPEYDEDIRCVVLLSYGNEGDGGMVMQGYVNERQAMEDMCVHLRAMVQVTGS